MQTSDSELPLACYDLEETDVPAVILPKSLEKKMHSLFGEFGNDNVTCLEKVYQEELLAWYHHPEFVGP
jgi:hypothetical protein